MSAPIAQLVEHSAVKHIHVDRNRKVERSKLSWSELFFIRGFYFGANCFLSELFLFATIFIRNHIYSQYIFWIKKYICITIP